MSPELRRLLARVGAPVAFLLAVTIAVLVVRVGLQEDDVPSSPPVTAVDTATTGEEGRVHVVVRGETLAVIAAQYGTTVQALRELNPDLPGRPPAGTLIRVS